MWEKKVNTKIINSFDNDSLTDYAIQEKTKNYHNLYNQNFL